MLEADQQAHCCFFLALAYVCAVQPCEKGDQSVLKLTKRNNRAYLTCDTSIGDSHVIQDLPIIVQSVKKVDDCQCAHARAEQHEGERQSACRACHCCLIAWLLARAGVQGRSRLWTILAWCCTCPT